MVVRPVFLKMEDAKAWAKRLRGGIDHLDECETEGECGCMYGQLEFGLQR